MPELPEVETIKRGLERAILGHKITAVLVLEKRSVLPSVLAFRRGLIGDKIARIDRRGKYLIFMLSGGRTLIGHLRMTGQLVFDSTGELELPRLPTGRQTYARVIIEFASGAKLYFNDIRKFGRLELLPKNNKQALLPRVGIDFLELTLLEFQEAMRRRPRANIKAVLLDQRFFSGVGNIYADEVLYAARIIPSRSVGSLRDGEITALYLATQSILKSSIKHGGTSFSDYVDASGKQGSFVRLLRVYGRYGAPCKKCRTPIKKTRLAGRGTHYCEKCQK